MKKRDGTNRLCVDFRKLNKITEVDPEPTNTVAETIQNLSTNKWFSKIDLTKGYWQVPLAEEDVHKTAFSLPDGSYKVLRMPFGMVNSSATLMRAMRILLEGIENIEHVVDDILIHTVTWEENLGTLQELLQRMSAANLTARPSKTVISAHVIDFAGYRVGCGVTSRLEENLRKIRDAQRPRTKKEIRSFIGLTSFYRDYVANYSSIAAPLTDLTRKGKPNKVEWGNRRPGKVIPNAERSYHVATDTAITGPHYTVCFED